VQYHLLYHLQVMYDRSVTLENGKVVDMPFMIMNDLTSNSRISHIKSWSLCSAKVYKKNCYFINVTSI